MENTDKQNKKHKTAHNQSASVFTNNVHDFSLFPVHIYILYFQIGT